MYVDVVEGHYVFASHKVRYVWLLWSLVLRDYILHSKVCAHTHSVPYPSMHNSVAHIVHHSASK